MGSKLCAKFQYMGIVELQFFMLEILMWVLNRENLQIGNIPQSSVLRVFKSDFIKSRSRNIGISSNFALYLTEVSSSFFSFAPFDCNYENREDCKI